MRTDADRVKALHGLRENHCPTSPAFRQAGRAPSNEALARRYGKHPALLLWHVSNESAASATARSARQPSATGWRGGTGPSRR